MLKKQKMKGFVLVIAVLIIISTITVNAFASTIFLSGQRTGNSDGQTNYIIINTLLHNEQTEEKLQEEDVSKEEEFWDMEEELESFIEIENPYIYLLINNILNKESLTVQELADLLVEVIEITYENYIYYRYHINDTANLNILKLYSEGLLELDEGGNANPHKSLMAEEIESIVARINEPQPPHRPKYEKRINVPILMYHEINNLPKNGPTGLYVSQKRITEQLDALKKNGYNTITMDQLYNNWENETPIPPKPIVLTFDDGYISHFTYVYPELSKRGMTGTFYIITNLINKDKIRTSENLKNMYLDGMEIASHTVSHLDARYHTKARILIEYNESKKFLEKAIDAPIEHFCYPIGGVTQQARGALIELGYKTAARTTYGKANRNQGLLDLRRIRVDYNDNIRGFLNKIK